MGRVGGAIRDGIGRGRRRRFQGIGRKGAAQRTVGVHRALHGAFQIEIADLVDAVADILQVRVAHHLIDVRLELAGHPARLLDHLRDGLDRHREVFRPDEDHRDHDNQRYFRPGEIEHACQLSPAGLLAGNRRRGNRRENGGQALASGWATGAGSSASVAVASAASAAAGTGASATSSGASAAETPLSAPSAGLSAGACGAATD